MEPRPDHGETSYRGSGRLAGRKAGAAVEKYQHFGSATSLGRPGQPVELASIYVQLAAADASFATGNIYGAGGGQGQP
jgi:NAD(P)-dependent dehydrogenase (short-subunit alcohol dehydrogenase family)